MTLANTPRSPETFESFFNRCVRSLHRVRREGRAGPGGERHLAWYEARLEAAPLDDDELARAIEAAGPVRPHIGSEDICAIRKHAPVEEVRRRERRSAHERMSEAVVRRRLVADRRASPSPRMSRT